MAITTRHCGRRADRLLRAVMTAVLIAVAAEPAWALNTAEYADGPATPGGTQLDHLRGAAAYWKSPSQRTLTYWINVLSFCGKRVVAAGGCEKERAVADNLAAAAKDWADACPECAITFERVERKEHATFVVRHVTSVLNADGTTARPKYIAHAFYPSSAPRSRTLRISYLYFEPDPMFDPVGVLRHELGHILGYTHEHSAADPEKRQVCGWDSERLPAKLHAAALTEYDPLSVMHYPCARPSEKVMFTLSPSDIAGHRALYKPD